MGIDAINPHVKVGALTLRDRQILEILCAIDRPHRLLVLDEPTSSLLPEDTRWLHAVTRRRIADGASVLFISHMLDEVEDFCDEVSVQRNGRIVASHTSPGLDRKALVEQMIGRSLDAAFPERAVMPTTDQVTLRARDLTVGDAVRGVDLAVRPGEIVGIAALDGQGQAELFSALAGDIRPSSGAVELEGRPIRLGSPRRAIRAGISFVPADRKTSGTVLDMTIRKNISLPVLDRVSTGGIVDDRREESAVHALMDMVTLERVRLDHPVRSLSGGNQQKVSFARALASGSPALLLYDPTRGVDVGTKFELYKLIQQAAAEEQPSSCTRPRSPRSSTCVIAPWPGTADASCGSSPPTAVRVRADERRHRPGGVRMTTVSTTGRQAQAGAWLRRVAEDGIVVPAVFLVTLLAVYAARTPGALDPDQLRYTLFNASVALVLVAAGLALVVMVGGLDLSSGGVVAVVNAFLTVHYGGGVGTG
ncbi:ATP-binding cassette domain-containing protein [Aeromicrobium sp. UC242_57]|uniref:ATP-binding cassette domain-containing protein n=1 Tax=Aeromicrobium sp. UC242_57 TaxID=3374624 RepID=UPI0037BF2D27